MLHNLHQKGTNFDYLVSQDELDSWKKEDRTSSGQSWGSIISAAALASSVKETTSTNFGSLQFWRSSLLTQRPTRPGFESRASDVIEETFFCPALDQKIHPMATEASGDQGEQGCPATGALAVDPDFFSAVKFFVSGTLDDEVNDLVRL